MTTQDHTSPAQAEKEAIAQLFAAGRYADSERLTRSVTAAYPDDAFGWKALGATLQQTGRTAEALEPMQRAATLAPGDAEAHSNLGTAFASLERFEEATAAYRQAIAINPSLAEVHCKLGAALRALGQPEEAEAAYRSAIALNPEHAEAHVNMGNALREQERLDEAEAAYRQAIALRPGYPKAHHNLGTVLVEMGRPEDAASAYRTAIAGDPGLAGGYRNLGLLTRYSGDDPRIPRMEQLYRQRQLPESDHIHVCFALGKACEDLDRIDDAFAYYAEGNRLRKRQLGYSLDRDRPLFAAIQRAFPQAMRPPPPSANPGEPRPIFIVGMPRSGTTLVEQILSSHSQVFGAGELEAMNLALRAEFIPDGQGRFNHDAEAIARIRRSYRTALARVAPDTPVMTDKMPSNFRWIGFMLEAFPEARVVNLVRDPVAVCWSIYKHYFPFTGLGFAYDLADLAGYYGLYRELMAFWRERFPDRIYDLDYELLTESQEPQTRALLEYCGLDWEEGCLDFHRNTRVIRTASSLQVRKGLYKGSSEAWKKFERHLAPLAEALGDPSASEGPGPLSGTAPRSRP